MMPPDEQKDFEDLGRASSSARPANAPCQCESVFFWCCSIKKFSTTSALGVALWWGKRRSRGGDRLNGRESEGQRDVQPLSNRRIVLNDINACCAECAASGNAEIAVGWHASGA